MEVKFIQNKDLKISKGKRLKTSDIQTRMFVILFVAPAFIGYLVLSLFPNILSVYYSLLEWDGISKAKFVGLSNYIQMFSDRFMLRALSHNLALMIVVPIITVLFAVFAADFLVTRAYRENSFYKILFFFPNILSSVIIALMWSFIYDGSFGLLNGVLKLVGIDVGRMYWLGDERFALICVMVPMIWSAVGFYLIIFMNAMSSIPKSLYESAVLDGITNVKRLFLITLPLISGVIRVAVIFLLLGVLKGFEMILILTAGGPGGATDVISLYMFSYAFGGIYSGGGSGTNYGYASTIGMVLFVILLIIKMLIDKFFKKDTIEF